MNDVKKNEYNLRSILLHSNANPIGSKDNVGYCCSFCMKKFPSPLNLKKHFLEEHNSDTQIVNNVGRLFQRLVKVDMTDLNCSLCCRDFDALSNFIQHLKDDHNEAVFPDVKNFIVPFKFDSEELRCALCSIEFVTFKLLQEHMHVHYRNYICQICNAGYVNKKAYLNHTMTPENSNAKNVTKPSIMTENCVNTSEGRISVWRKGINVNSATRDSWITGRKWLIWLKNMDCHLWCFHARLATEPLETSER